MAHNHVEYVEGCYACKLKSVGFSSIRPATKVTAEGDSSMTITTTEHWHDRQDVAVKLNDAVHLPRSMAPYNQGDLSVRNAGNG